ncbi:hypothetical protein BGZ60DRAFT_522958 [Tricladium varicosporioides]|nr:hypothetical protein BGZ60DRAFT_522958 [Hymenoscyphus varicosporioides]
MDSMRSLNTSLPGTSPSKQSAGEPSEQILQAFKAAALATTTLYKTAASNQSKARAEGYQDALDELLAFLDKEDIGLNDGEGWRIRRWATERLDGRDSVSQNNESEDETVEKTDGASSPILQRSQSATRLNPNMRTGRTLSPVRIEPQAPQSAPPSIAATPTPTPVEAFTSIPQQTNFTFRATHPYPQDADIILSDLDISDNTRTQSHEGTGAPGITVTRPRATPRHNSHSARLGTRNTNTIGRGAGQKRKINIGEFFDIGNVSGKEGFGGGGKRGRFA